MRGRVKRGLIAVVAPACLAAALAVVALPTMSEARPAGTQTLSAAVSLSCVVNPGEGAGFYNAPATVAGTFTVVAPTSVSPGDSLTLSQVSMSLTLPSSLTSDLGAIGITTASVVLTAFPLSVAGATSAIVNAAAGGVAFEPVAVSAGSPLTSSSIPVAGPLSLSLGTVIGAVGSDVAIAVDSATGIIGPDSSGYYASTGGGVQALATVGDGDPNDQFTEPIDCNVSAATLGSVTVVAAPVAAVSTASLSAAAAPAPAPTRTVSSSQPVTVTPTTGQTTTTTSATTTASATRTSVVPPRALTQAQKLAAAMKACGKLGSARKRAACVAGARRRFPAPRRMLHVTNLAR